MNLRFQFGFLFLFGASSFAFWGCDSSGKQPITKVTSAEPAKSQAEQKAIASSAASKPAQEQNAEDKIGSGTSSADSDETFESKLVSAEQLLQKGAHDEAWKIAKGLLIQRPNDADALFVSSRIMAKRNDLKGAIGLISRIDPDHPKAGDAAVGQLSEWLAQSGDLYGAEANLLRLLKKHPTAVPAIRLLIDVYSAQCRRWESAKYLDRLVRLGDFTEAELIKAIDYREPYDNESLRKAALRLNPNDPFCRLGEIRTFTFKGVWGQFHGQLSEISKQKPDQLEPWIWYGESLIETGRSNEIPAWLKDRPTGYLTHPEYWYILGLWYYGNNSNSEAARCFTEAIKLDRRHVAAMVQLSEVLLRMGDEENSKRARVFSGHLVRINDLAQQIQRGYGTREDFVDIARRYREVGDEIGAFGWEALVVANDKKPLPAELISKQKELRTLKLPPSKLLDGMPVDQWVLPPDNVVPDSTSMESASPSIASTLTIKMSDVAEQLGLDCQYDNGAEPGRGWFTLEGVGGGVTAIDYDRDGWVDLYFSQAGDSPTKPSPAYKPKKLFRSLASKKFVETTRSACVVDFGYGQSVGTADLDQDGFSDLMVANVGRIECYRNMGDGTFERMEMPQAPQESKWNSSLQAADINGDTIPDIFHGVYIDGDEVFVKWCQNTTSNRGNCHPKRFTPGRSRVLFSSDEESSTFGANWRLAPQSLLDSLKDGYAFGALITNVDQAAGNDVFIANDVSPNHFLLSQIGPDGKQHLVECAAESGVAVDSSGRAQACMGIASGDQNRDGLIDIIVTNYRHEVSTLYLQTRPGVFTDGTRGSSLGIYTREWLSFGCQLMDLDNDGWLDFITVNGHIDDLTSEGMQWKMPPQVLKNNRGKFEWLRTPSPGPYFDVDNVGRGLTMVDYNRDGRGDVVATHLDRQCALLENQSPTNGQNFIQLELIGTKSERDAVGAIIRVIAGSESWVVPVTVGDGFYGTNERLSHIGLGNVSSISRIEIDWPSGIREQYEVPLANRRYQVIEGQGLFDSFLAQPQKSTQPNK